MTSPAPRAVIYVRQSIARDDSVSPELQRTACTDHCTRAGYSVVEVVEDLGISGRTWKRPGVQQVMTMVEARDVDVIVLWKWSRLSRSRLDWAVATDRVEQAGGRIESATEPIDVSTASGRLARGMLAEFAAFESERIGEQWKEAHARRRRLGQPAQGGGRYGYQIDDVGSYSPHREQGPLLVGMYEAFISGQGNASIARDLNTAGHQNRLGRPWSRTTVRVLLDSGFAAGLLVSGRGARATWVPGGHPPLITADTWTAYQRARRGRATTAPRLIEPRYSITGLLRCGDCGSAMHATHGGKRRTDGSWVNGNTFVCARWRTTGEGRCVTMTRNAIETTVQQWLTALGDDIDAAASAEAATATRRAAAAVDARTHARRVTELDRQLTELTRLLLDGTIPETAYATTRDQLTTERAAAHQQLLDAETTAAGTAGADTAALARTLLATWDELGVRVRRDLLAALLRHITIHPPATPHGRARCTITPSWAPELV